MIKLRTTKTLKQILATPLLVIVFGIGIILPLKEALAADAPVPLNYIPLSTIPGVTKTCVPGADGSTGGCEPADPTKLVSNVYTISIGIAAILAIGMIIWAGIQYATTEAITGKSEAKKHWQGAIGGLLLLISSYLILRTINIGLVTTNLQLNPQNPVCAPTYDSSGNPIPCGAEGEVASLQQLQQTLSAQRTATIAAAEQASQLVKTKEDELAVAIAADLSEEEIKRIENELASAKNTESILQQTLSVNNSYSAITGIASRGLYNFDTAAKENNTMALASAVNAFSVETNMALKTAETLKLPNGDNVFSAGQLSIMRAEFNETLSYMDKYVTWKSGGSKGAEPQRPEFSLPISPSTPTSEAPNP